VRYGATSRWGCIGVSAVRNRSGPAIRAMRPAAQEPVRGCVAGADREHTARHGRLPALHADLRYPDLKVAARLLHRRRRR
jgi:hypothetical protein